MPCLHRGGAAVRWQNALKKKMSFEGKYRGGCIAFELLCPQAIDCYDSMTKLYLSENTLPAKGVNRVAIKHKPMDGWLLKLISLRNSSALHAIADEMGSPPHFSCWISVSKQ